MTISFPARAFPWYMVVTVLLYFYGSNASRPVDRSGCQLRYITSTVQYNLVVNNAKTYRAHTAYLHWGYTPQ